VLIPGPKTDRAQPQANGSPGRDDRPAQRSHGSLLDETTAEIDRMLAIRSEGTTPRGRSHVARPQQAAANEEDSGKDDQQATATTAGIGAVRTSRAVPTAAAQERSTHT